MRCAWQEFEEAVLYGKHIDEILVLKDGVRRLGQADAVPEELLQAVQREKCTRSFLDSLSEELLQSLRGRIYCTASGSRDEYELKKQADGTALDTLLDKRAEVCMLPLP